MIQGNRNLCKDSNIFVYSDFDTKEAESYMWVLKTQPLKNKNIFLGFHYIQKYRWNSKNSWVQIFLGNLKSNSPKH